MELGTPNLRPGKGDFLFQKFRIGVSPENSQISRTGRSQGGRCANLLQAVRQICAKLAFRFIDHTKSAQN